MSDEPVADWRASNDEVGRIGGWRAYAREAQAPETESTTLPENAAPVVPVQGGHGMRDKHSATRGK